MSGWGWVLVGYGLTAIVLIGYLWSLVRRTARAEARLERLD